MRSMRGNAQALMLGVVVVVIAAALYFFMKPEAESDVVLYCGVDQDQSTQIADLFEQESGLSVDFHGESEASRSVGLPKRLQAEKDNPRAGVYWSNEIMHMVDLANSGILAPLPKGVAEMFPEEWRDPNGEFIQFGARARVFLVNLDLLPDEKDHPKNIRDLFDPKWKEQGLFTTMAAPLTGTTYTHAVTLLTQDEKAARAFFEECAKAGKDGRMKIVASNGRVMRAVSEKGGKVAFGLTDTDDALIAIENMRAGKGANVKVIYPDQDAEGSLLIPNTCALIKGGPNPEQAARFLRWLARPETEARLANGPSAQIPVREGVGELPDHVKVPGKDFKAMRVDWAAVGANANTWHDYLNNLFRAVD
ncbi:MAG: extracellular solute-binding protein [Planctomycetota bacterium]|nr:extracellular solute-binding protein [Planctomycetota bacterium]